MKYQCLVLNFRDAKTFRGPKSFGDDHRMVELGGITSRKDRPSSWVDVPPDTLYVNHVSNVLHVLMGERPVPSFRAICTGAHKRVESIHALAADASVIVGSGIQTYIKDGAPKTALIREKMTTRKAVKNSFSKTDVPITIAGESRKLTTCMLSWDRIEHHLGLELYPQFVTMATSVLGLGWESQPVTSVFSSLHDYRGDSRVESFCMTAGVPESYRAIILGGKTDGQYFHQSGYGDLAYMFITLISRGVEDVSCVGGKIFVPVDDEAVEKIRSGPGFATLLEGGLVTIEGVYDMSDLLVVGSKPVFMGA